MHGFLIIVHVLAGSAGLALGPVAMVAPKRRGLHTRAGSAYQIAVVALTTSATGLAILDWRRLWWLALIAVATEAAALGGVWVQRRRRHGWMVRHLRLECGSYVSLVTALLVVNWRSPVAWVLPTVIATPLIFWAANRAKSGTRSDVTDLQVRAGS